MNNSTEPKGEGAIEEAARVVRGGLGPWRYEWLAEHHRDGAAVHEAWKQHQALDSILEALVSLRTAKEELEGRVASEAERGDIWRKVAIDCLAAKEELEQSLIAANEAMDEALAGEETAERERDEARAGWQKQTAEWAIRRKEYLDAIDTHCTSLSHSEAERGRLEEALKRAEAYLLVIADGEWNEQHVREAEGRDLDIHVEAFARQALSNQPSNQER